MNLNGAVPDTFINIINDVKFITCKAIFAAAMIKNHRGIICMTGLRVVKYSEIRKSFF